MRLLFVSPPHCEFSSHKRSELTFSVCRILATGNLSLAGYVREQGHTCHIIDGNRIAWRLGNIASLVYAEMIRQAVKFKPDIVAVTILTADFYEAQKFIRMVRRALPKAMLIAGGPHPSGEPEFTLRQIPELDGIGIGPGEEICLDLANGKPIVETAGCAYLDGEEVVFVKRRRLDHNIDRFPFPAWNLVDADYYAELNHATVFGLLTRSLPILTSRGCSGSCYFCSWKWNRPFRMHSVNYVLDSCEYLVAHYSIDTIAFWDDTIGAVRSRLVEICEGFIERHLNEKLKWVAQLRADQVESGLLELMKEAGCIKVSFGAESGNDRILKLLKKGISVSQNIEAAKLISEAGLHLGFSLMMGVPTETEEEMLDTVRFITKFPQSVSTGVGRFCPLPGSPAYSEFVRTERVNPETVNWKLLGNFSSIEGPYFGKADAKKFRSLLQLTRIYCRRKYATNFRRNHAEKYPEVVDLCFPQEPYAVRLLKRLSNLLSPKMRQALKEMYARHMS